MIQHMNLVFQAGGLSVGEGAFLMACANHTDAKGYVIAHMQQIADEAHMSLRTAQANRAKLEKRKLLKAAPRFSPKNRAQLANLFRINLDLLKSMERERKDYGATLIEELTFDEVPDEAPDAAPEENRRSDPHADSAPLPAKSAPPPADFAPPPADLAGGGGAKSAPLLLPSSSPSSLSPVPGDSDVSAGTTSDGGEREAATPGGAVPEPRSEQPEPEGRPAVRIARRWAAERQARGVFTSPDRVAALVKEADALLAKGQSVERLEREVSVMADHPTWVSLMRHMESVRPAVAAVGGGGERPRGPGGPLSAAARAILAQGSGL